MKKTMFALTLSLLSLSAYCGQDLDFSIFDSYQRLYSKDYLEKRIKNFLEKDSGVSKLYEIHDNSLILKDENAQVEYELDLVSAELNETIVIPQKKTLKIALDPGHLGGKYAKLEGRYFHQLPVLENNNRDDLVVKEGDINLFTALALKEMLESKGVEVFMTRDAIGESSFGKTFERWLDEDYSLFVEEQIKDLDEDEKRRKRKEYDSLGEEDKFYLFAKEDLYNRAKVVNDIGVDFAVSIHFNSCGRKLSTGRYVPSKDNFTMVFTGGSFEGSEMLMQNHRFNFLRLLLTNHIEVSQLVAFEVVKQFRDNLNVPIVDPAIHIAPYLDKSSMKLNDGDWARNLAFVREVHAPAILGEPVCADNAQEGLLLDSHIVNKDSARIQAVANSYFQGIIKAFGL